MKIKKRVGQDKKNQRDYNTEYSSPTRGGKQAYPVGFCIFLQMKKISSITTFCMYRVSKCAYQPPVGISVAVRPEKQRQTKVDKGNKERLQLADQSEVGPMF